MTKSVKSRFETSTAVGVSIMNNGEDCDVVNGLTFTYHTQPSCTSISPKSGFWMSGKSITLCGSNLIDTSNNLCTVSDI